MQLIAVLRGISRDMDKQETMPRQIQGYLSETELALKLDMSVWGLRAWRKRAYGPAAVKIGRAVLYSMQSVEDFIASLESSSS